MADLSRLKREIEKVWTTDRTNVVPTISKFFESGQDLAFKTRDDHLTYMVGVGMLWAHHCSDITSDRFVDSVVRQLEKFQQKGLVLEPAQACLTDELAFIDGEIAELIIGRWEAARRQNTNAHPALSDFLHDLDAAINHRWLIEKREAFLVNLGMSVNEALGHPGPSAHVLMHWLNCSLAALAATRFPAAAPIG